MLGFCEIGGGGKLAESGETTLGGRLPVNPSGGLESKGHPMGASGLAQIFELVHQLRGDCGIRQVPGARVALAENGGGLYGGGEAGGGAHPLTSLHTSEKSISTTQGINDDLSNAQRPP